jgi:transposase
MLNEGMNERKAINYLSSITGSTNLTIENLYYEYKNNRIIHSPDTSRMGRGNPLHPLYQHEWSLETELQIHNKIEEYNKTKGFCNTNDIKNFLLNNFNINISRNGLARRLHSLGYIWGRSRTIGGMTLAARIARGVTYMKELSLAIEEENSNNSVIIYSDESYVNVRHKIQYTWFSPYSLTKNEVGGPTGKGDREIIIHSISKDGY